MIAQELGHVSDDSNQVLLHVLVPHQLEVRLVLVLQSVLVGFKVESYCGFSSNDQTHNKAQNRVL